MKKPQTISSRLADWIQREGLSHDEACRRLGGVSIRTFNDWLYGKRNPSKAARSLIMERIAK